ncbi:MAG: hypothetical protein FWE94_05365 [Coriobacteriia bacterium]|nr:hypothetical protein [Coriobacteriia bacterium]
MAVLVCLLLTGTALALTNTWGIMSFLRYRTLAGVPTGTEAGIQKDPAQEGGHSKRATFIVREAIFDGQSVFLNIAVKPTKADYLLIATDTMPDYPLDELGASFAGKSGNIAQYAEANNLAVVRAWVGIEGFGITSYDYVVEDDGTLAFLVSSTVTSNEESLKLEARCGTTPFINDGSKWALDETATEETTLSFKLDNNGKLVLTL